MKYKLIIYYLNNLKIIMIKYKDKFFSLNKNAFVNVVPDLSVFRFDKN